MNAAAMVQRLRREPHPVRFLASRALWSTGACRLLCIQRDGYQLRFSPTAMAASLWVDPELSQSDERFLREVLRPGDAVVDAGANIGALTVLAAQLIGDAGRVVAIEPHPRTVKWLRDNVALNGCTNVHVVEAALADAPGEARMSDQRSDDQNRLMVDGKGPVVRTVTLDEVAARVGDVRLLKLDLEGYELPALRGARETLKRTEIVYFEVFDAHAARCGYRTADVVALLEDAGFSVSRWDGRRRVPVEWPPQAVTCENWVAERQ